jgi:hypothetical protein
MRILSCACAPVTAKVKAAAVASALKTIRMALILSAIQ